MTKLKRRQGKGRESDTKNGLTVQIIDDKIREIAQRLQNEIERLCPGMSAHVTALNT